MPARTQHRWWLGGEWWVQRTHPTCWEEGNVIPPTGPELGITLDEELARAHAYEGDELHLEMKPTPCEP